MTRILLATIAALSLVAMPAAESTQAADPTAQPAPARPGPGPAPGRGQGPGPAARRFDPATVSTYTGTIEAVYPQSKGRRSSEGVHADLKTAEGVLDVHLGPAAFLREKLALAKGDAVEITGSKVDGGGKPALIAQTVKKGGTTVTLRDAQGVPAWSRRGKR